MKTYFMIIGVANHFDITYKYHTVDDELSTGGGLQICLGWLYISFNYSELKEAK